MHLKLQAFQNCHTKLLNNYFRADIPQTASTAEMRHKITYIYLIADATLSTCMAKRLHKSA